MSDKNHNLNALISDFLEHLEVERGLSPLSIRNYHFWLNRFSFWLAKNYSEIQTVGITADHILKYRVWLSRIQGRKEPGLALSTQAYHVIAIRAFLRWCARQDIPSISSEKIDVPKSREHSLTFLNSEQLDRLLISPDTTNIRGLRDRAMLEMLFSTGLRVSELVSLNCDQVDLNRREFSVIGKGGRARVVFLSERAADWIKKYLQKRHDSYRPLLIHYGGQKPEITTDDNKLRLTARSVQRLVTKYQKKAGLGIHITPHSLRHTFATDLLQGGADLREVQELLGHKNVSTTQIYTHVTNRRLRDVHTRAHSGNK